MLRGKGTISARGNSMETRKPNKKMAKEGEIIREEKQKEHGIRNPSQTHKTEKRFRKQLGIKQNHKK